MGVGDGGCWVRGGQGQTRIEEKTDTKACGGNGGGLSWEQTDNM